MTTTATPPIPPNPSYEPPPTTTNPSTTTPSSTTYTPPAYTTFPPFYTLQPNLTTRTRQLSLWTQHILSYTSHARIFKLSLTNPPPNLFANPSLHRSLSPPDTRTVLEHMVSHGQAAWLPPASRGEQSTTAWIFWRSLAEWADAVYAWVDGRGLRASVLTVYELREGEESGREWEGCEEGFLRLVLGVLVGRGKAVVFGEGEGEGVKFF